MARSARCEACHRWLAAVARVEKLSRYLERATKDELEARNNLVHILNGGSSLSDREAEVMSYMEGGLSNKEIATKLGLQERTIKFHVTKILRKKGVSSRTDFAKLNRPYPIEREAANA